MEEIRKEVKEHLKFLGGDESYHVGNYKSHVASEINEMFDKIELLYKEYQQIP